ncbi:hypothetical protein GU926_13740 [Nibribacter ruber]|uniref:Uncharacterized protein n=1 Tax=Nibribacter ruber TaxID=2698458 RepID=A0A6P1NX28_9BACT|nr:hypothetical protein [Nibribacter ruber]QHL88436.1 hypothetical protein GU926_13740 [Nibribacter ruber]
MTRFAYSERTIQQLKKKQITFFALLGAFICLTLVYILFIGKTLGLSTTTAILFLLGSMLLTGLVGYYMVRLLEAILRKQYFVVTDAEVQKVVNGQATASLETHHLTDIKTTKKGVQLISTAPPKTLFIPNTLDHYQDLLAEIEKRVQ